MTTTATVLPLTGTSVRAVGDTVPVRVAASRLRALGCVVDDRIERDGGAPPASAGRIDLLTRAGDRPAGCDISWSDSGPPLTGERDVQAACGLAYLHGRPRGGPRFLPVDYASVCAGVLAAQAVTGAVLVLERGGPALRASVSVAGAALLTVAPYAAEATASLETLPDPGTGPPPPFRSADGIRFEVETLDPEAWLVFWEALGAPREAIAAGWPPFRRRFATAVCPLPETLSTVLGSLPFSAVRETAQECGVGVVPLRPLSEAADEGPASPWRLRPTGTASAPPLPPWTANGAGPLSGLRLVEATNRVQGPLAGLLLTLMGADTVRVEPPGGDPMRGVPPLAGGLSARFTALNRDKRAAEHDLRTGEGRRAAAELAAAGHVLLYNWPPGRAERFGLGVGDLDTHAPGLVHVHADGWAGEEPEPAAPATDFLVQAHGGIADLLSDGTAPPAPSLVTLTDVLGGLLATEAALAGLLLRSRTGRGAAAHTALVDAARLLRTTGRGSAHRDREGTPPATDPVAAAAAFPESFTASHGTVLPRAPWTFTPVDEGGGT